MMQLEFNEGVHATKYGVPTVEQQGCIAVQLKKVLQGLKTTMEMRLR